MTALLHNSVVANLDKSGQNERMVNFSKTDLLNSAQNITIWENNKVSGVSQDSLYFLIYSRKI